MKLGPTSSTADSRVRVHRRTPVVASRVGRGEVVATEVHRLGGPSDSDELPRMFASRSIHWGNRPWEPALLLELCAENSQACHPVGDARLSCCREFREC